MTAGYVIDANLPRWFEPWSGPGYVFAHDMGPSWSDTQLWDYATSGGFTIVSKDSDFAFRALATASGPRVIHFRTGNLTMRDFHQIVTPIWTEACRLSAACRLVYVYRDGLETVDGS